MNERCHTPLSLYSTCPATLSTFPGFYHQTTLPHLGRAHENFYHATR